MPNGLSRIAALCASSQQATNVAGLLVVWLLHAEMQQGLPASNLLQRWVPYVLQRGLLCLWHAGYSLLQSSQSQLVLMHRLLHGF